MSMINYKSGLKVIESKSLSLDLKNQQSFIPEKIKHNKNSCNQETNSENFQEVLKNVIIKEKEKENTDNQEVIEVIDAIENNNSSNLSMLPSMQYNPGLCIKKRM